MPSTQRMWRRTLPIAPIWIQFIDYIWQRASWPDVSRRSRTAFSAPANILGIAKARPTAPRKSCHSRFLRQRLCHRARRQAVSRLTKVLSHRCCHLAGRERSQSRLMNRSQIQCHSPNRRNQFRRRIGSVKLAAIERDVPCRALAVGRSALEMIPGGIRPRRQPKLKERAATECTSALRNSVQA
jgi:hypothetical protein